MIPTDIDTDEAVAAREAALDQTLADLRSEALASDPADDAERQAFAELTALLSLPDDGDGDTEVTLLALDSFGSAPAAPQPAAPHSANEEF